METAQYSLNILIIAGVALFVLGLVLGLLAGRRSSPAAKRQRDTELKLEQVQQDRKAYEDEVAEHFTDTAKLLNNLTERYRDVHNHLAQGASKLCKGEGPISLDRLEDRRTQSDIPAGLADVHPPLDYAPKASPGEKGMLSEDFGIDRKQAAKESDKPKAKPDPEAH